VCVLSTNKQLQRELYPLFGSISSTNIKRLGDGGKQLERNLEISHVGSVEVLS